MCRRSGLTLIEGLVIVAMILVICAIAIPGLMSSERASNERTASTALKTLSSAEADFRSNDRDWNHVNDFWTGDVKGLFTMTSAAVRGAGTAPMDPPIKLIEIETAAADVDPAVVPAGGENMALPQPPAARKGYWFVALLTDLTLKDDGGEEAIYKRDTGGTPTMGKCHNMAKFGFAAIPDTLWRGKYAFIVNENNTIFREALTDPARRGAAVPPGIDGVDPAFLHWPDDSKYKSSRSLID